MKASLFAQFLMGPVASAAALNCSIDSFATILPANATVIQAVMVPENGTFGDPNDLEFPGVGIALPETCAVEVRVPTSSSSAYRFGLSLPTKWNHRFLATGNGGFGGGINWPGLGTFTRYGFAAVSTDTGHQSATFNATWAINNTEGQIDWGYRALHGSVVLSKEIVDAYYGVPHQYSYYSGCSTGGRQGFKEAQEFPDDFDGVLAGAPAWWTTHLQTWSVKVGLDNLPLNGPNHISQEAMTGFVADEILRQCDPQDGLEDGIISRPYSCDIDFEQLLCTSSSKTSSCLTSAQVQTLYQLYSDYVETNQTFVFPHLSLGSEWQSGILISGQNDAPSALGTSYVGSFLYNTSNYDWRSFSYETVQFADALDPGNATADNFDLTPFKTSGAKLIHYHGYADGFIPVGSSIYLYKQIQQALLPMGETLDDFYRFFLIPGMGHCGNSQNNAPWVSGTIREIRFTTVC